MNRIQPAIVSRRRGVAADDDKRRLEATILIVHFEIAQKCTVFYKVQK